MSNHTGVEFERPYPLTELTAESSAQCSTCGTSAARKPTSELVAILHRHPRDKDGVWRVYCRDHLGAANEFAVGEAAPAKRNNGREHHAPVLRVICQSCYVEVPSATRWCDVCEVAVP